jgi:hypothetical protein
MQLFKSTLAISVAATIVLLGSAPTNATAQLRVLSSLQGYVSVGATTPQAPRGFTDLNGTGVSIRAGVGLPLASRWSGVLSGSYHTLPSTSATGPFFDSTADLSGSVTAEGGYTAFTAMAELKYDLFATELARLYFIGGLGGYYEEASFEAQFDFDDTTRPNETERSTFETTGMLASVGGGFMLLLTQTVGVFVEPRYGVLFYSPQMERYVAIRGGVAFRP